MEGRVVARESSKPVKAKLRKGQRQDDSIMGTNNSSIVSKRSVERLYFPDEAHYFRFFVKKPQRRAPLINRGYWLRMKAIDEVVRRFLETPSEKQRVIINLGCGDPLPWQCLSRYPSACNGVKFVDVDYAELMLRKRAVIQNTYELHSLFTNYQQSTGDVLFHSDQYLQLGCDLRDLPRLEKALAGVVDFENSHFLFTAEVSITYMGSQESDALIKWASGLPQARFCLLEQILPDGADHPFAQTMMAHFNKLQTPLGAIQKYPTKYAQEERFVSLGWAHASALNLWELWSSPDFISSGQRSSLDEVEPFDEWEEFALFGCHYFLLVADNSVGPPQHIQANPHRSQGTQARSEIRYSQNCKSQGLRRFAAALPVRISGQTDDGFGVFAGMGKNTRTASCDIYTNHPTLDGQASSFIMNGGPSSRVCHTITDLGETGSLLVGGRTSPDNALSDCWLYHKWINIWERIDDIPQARYRHSAIELGNGFALISPGRTSSRNTTADFFIWSRLFGWRRCNSASDDAPPATYGATFTLFDSASPAACRKGILAGGISKYGIVQEGIWLWEVLQHKSKHPIIYFKQSLCTDHVGAPIARFGAVSVNHDGHTYILGGIVKNELLTLSDEACRISTTEDSEQARVVSSSIPIRSAKPRPLFIGIAAIQGGDSLLITGGGAVCFSFGTFWNEGCFSLNTLPVDHQDSADISALMWRYLGSSDASMAVIKPRQLQANVPVTTAPRVKVQSRKDFDLIVRAGKPVIIETLDLGSCIEKWTVDYLKENIGAQHEVIVHEASSEHMDFQSKNFAYVNKAFGEFIDQAKDGGRLYLRSVSSQNPTQQPADIKRDFPSLADDFKLPPEVAIAHENFHSSPLRISGPVTMWLHYDVMANVLCQIRGSKRLFLFPPTDISHLEFEPGASSTGINCFERLQSGTLPDTHPHEAVLLPGDVLFLPPLWPHTASPTSGLSIAVNVFFRNLQAGYAAGRDVYGNRDLQVYEKGRQDVAKVIKTFDNLPMDMRVFYLSRLAREFEQMTL